MTEADIAIGVESAAFGDDLKLGTQVDDIAHLGDTFVVHDVKFSSAEWGGDFVLDHPNAHTAAGDLCPGFDGLDAAGIQPDGGIEF